MKKLLLLVVLLLSGCSSIATKDNPDRVFYGEIIELIKPSEFKDVDKLNSLSLHQKGSSVARVLIGGGAGGVTRQTVVYAYAYTDGKVGDIMKMKGLTDIALEGINDRYLLSEQIKLIESNEFTCYTKKLPVRPNPYIGFLTLLTTGTESFALSVHEQFKDKDEYTKCEGWFSYYDEHVAKYHFYKHERHANRSKRSEEQISTANSEKLKLNSLIDNRDGTITDNVNKLQWMRCSLGQKWDGKTCVGQVDKMSVDNAAKQIIDYSNNKDWRLPTKDELLSIRYCSDGFKPGMKSGVKICSDSSLKPTINNELFPNTQASGYWTSTVNNANPQEHSFIHFHYGDEDKISKEVELAVRLVRDIK